MTATAAFWDKVAARYAARPVSDVPAWEETLERTRAYLGPDARVLEVGCGTGSSALRLAGDAGHITATDISPQMIAIARTKLGEVSNIDFELGALDSVGGQYDVVIAYNLLQLIADIPAAARQAFALTKPGGVFISKSTCLANLHIARPIIWVMRMLGKAPRVTFMSGDDLDRAMQDAGFTLEVAEMLPAKGRNRFIVARRP